MATFARVPVVPGPVLEIYIGSSLFAMHATIAATWHSAPGGTLVGDQYDGVSYTSGALTLSQARTKRNAYLLAAYNADLIDGFTSSALGAPHDYTSDANAITTLNALISAGNTADYLHYDSGVPTSASHTLTQLRQVRDDLISDRQTSMDNYATKVASVNAAATINDVNAINY